MADLPNLVCGMPIAGQIGFVYCDPETKAYVPLGACAWLDAGQLRRMWAHVPEAPGNPYVADLYDEDLEIIDSRPIDAATVERFTHRPVGELIAEGEERNADDPDRPQEYAAARAELGRH